MVSLKFYDGNIYVETELQKNINNWSQFSIACYCDLERIPSDWNLKPISFHFFNSRAPINKIRGPCSGRIRCIRDPRQYCSTIGPSSFSRIWHVCVFPLGGLAVHRFYDFRHRNGDYDLYGIRHHRGNTNYNCISPAVRISGSCHLILLVFRIRYAVWLFWAVADLWIAGLSQ